MANQFTGTTFSGTYKDDFRDSAGYHKVLFNSGRALQGRELNQLQTILQTQITRMANNIFMDGAAVSPKSSGAGTDIVDYVIVEQLLKSPNDYIGAVFQGPAITGSNGLQFQVSHVEEGNGSDYPTFYGRYVSANQSGVSTDTQTDILTFSEGDTLSNVSGEGLAALAVRTQPAASTTLSTGKGVLFSMQQAEFYVQGHFVYAPKQTIVIQKYDQYCDTEVGFEVIQDVATVADDVNLYDNQGARPNLSAPGADRYRIRMVLTTADLVAEEENFCTFATVRASRIVQIKEGTDNFNQFEKRMAIRQEDTTGDFIVNDFEIQFREGDDSASIILEVPADALGVNPMAFLDGYRLEHQVGVAFNAEKPVSFVADSNQSMNANYKNYVSFVADSAGGSALGSLDVVTIEQQKKMKLRDASNATIGNARIKSIVNRGTLDDDNYRMYLYDVKMKGSNNFRDVRGISTFDGTGVAVPVREDHQLYISQPEVNTSIFRIPGGRVKSIDVNNFTVQRHHDQLADGSSQLTITCSADEQFTDEGQWLFINRTTNTVSEIGSGAISVVGSTATISLGGQGSPSDAYSTFYYVQKNNPAPRSKTYREGWFDATRTTDSSGDHFAFSNLYDGVSLLEAYATDSNGSNLQHSVEFDGGQRDNFYGPATLRPDGVPSNVSSIRAKVGYFQWGANADFFSVNSYDLEDSTWFDYSDIPTFISRQSGTSYDLHDVLDFRPKLDPSAEVSGTSNRFEMPRDADQIIYGAQFYNNRIDQVALTYDDEFKAKIVVNKGEEGQEPLPPSEKQKEMVLFDVAYNGNTKDVSDLAFNRRTYRGYKMTDINDIESRIARLEETVSLSFLEQEASSLVELTGEGLVRSKTGFFVDDFTKGYALTASTSTNEFIDDASFATSSLDDETFTVHCKMDAENVGFQYDSDNLFSSRGVTKSNVVRKGDNLMLAYQEVLDDTMKQEMISWKGGAVAEEHGYYNVNPFNVFLGEGTLRLNPSRDIWFDQRRLPDRHINGGTIRRQVGEPVIPRTFTFSRNSVTSRWVTRITTVGGFTFGGNSNVGGTRVQQIARVTTTNTDTFRFSQSVRTRVVGSSTFTRNLGDRTVAILSVPFMRQRRVLAKAQGLRPSTRYWCFMDGIRMDQWVRSRTETEYNNLRNRNAHRIEYPSTNVSARRTPFYDGTTNQKLVTDTNGELYFDLWIPNNARIPVPLSTSFNAVSEWSGWLKNQRRYAKQYGSSKSVSAMNRMGWKFRCGSKQVKLLDISVDKPNNALSRASSVYSAWGRVNVRQRSLVTTRVVHVQDFLVNRTDLVDRSSTTSATPWQTIWRPRDPLAQTFTVDGGTGVPGVFVTRVEVFIRSCPSASDSQVPLQLQIRNVNAGVPERDSISEQHTVFKTAAAIRSDLSGMNANNLGSVLGHPVSMEFEEPVFLRSGDEYAIVLLAECDKYEAYVASTYDLVLGSTSKRVNKQPAKGSLFLSQNGSTWTPKQNQDMAFRIYTAKFKASGGANFFNAKLPQHLHNFNTSLSVDSDNLSRLRVAHQGHGLGVGDVVDLSGLSNSTSYNGLAGSVIQNSANLVDSADVNGYFVTMSSPFTSTGPFGADSVSSNRGFNIDRATLNFEDLNFEQTSIRYQGSFVSGVSHASISLTSTADPRFNIDDTTTILPNKEEFFFNTPKYLANPSQEYSELSPLNDSAPSIVVGAALSTEQISTFGGDAAVGYRSSGYVSDVSPVIDTQTIGMVFVNNVIDNQATDSDSRSSVNNAPSDYLPETHPTLGTAPSKHITRIVQLNQAANGIKVMLGMYKPPAASFDVYYRTGENADADLYLNEWTLVVADNTPPDAVYARSDDNLEFQEYRYLIGGTEGTLPDFTSFQLKIVMKTTNTCQPPVLDSIRAIALI
jgi:hypothetical protein